jgi:hypothetical protein
LLFDAIEFAQRPNKPAPVYNSVARVTHGALMALAIRGARPRARAPRQLKLPLPTNEDDLAKVPQLEDRSLHSIAHASKQRYLVEELRYRNLSQKLVFQIAI